MAELVWATTFLLLGFHFNPHSPSLDLSDRIQTIWNNPLDRVFVIGLAILYCIGSSRDISQIRSRPWSEFYGDRLAAALKAGRGVEMAPHHEGPELPEDVSARELFGLGHRFTKAELRRAWIGLARELHPDRWTASGEGVRRMKEAALKRVNAARDELMPLAA